MSSPKFKQAVAAALCARLATGDESLRQICRDPAMPGKSTVMDWLLKGEQGEEPYAAFLAMYARAREIGIDEQFDKLQEMADDDSADLYTDKDGVEKTDAGRVQRHKLSVDALKWRLSKMAPKKYGDKVLVGEDAENPLPRVEDPATIAARIAAIFEAGRKRAEEAGEG